MNKNIAILGSLLLAVNAMGLENSIETGIKVNTIFSPRYEEKDVYPSKFRYETSGYDLTLANLKLVPIKELEFETVIKSSRKDFAINDFDKDVKHINNFKKRDANHDIMAKFSVNSNVELNKDLKLTNSLKYYLDDFWVKKTVDKSGKITEEVKTEYVEDDGEKEALGNSIFSSSLKGKLLNTNVDARLEYKANQFHRFDKDKSYFKTNINVDKDINDKFKLSSKYDFDIDLHNANIPFDAFDTKLDEFPDFHVGDYVTKFNQNANLEFEYSHNENNKYKMKFDLEHKAEYSGGNTKDKPYRVFYDILDPKLTINSNNSFILSKGKIVLDSNISTLFELRKANYLADEGKLASSDVKSKLEPNINSKISYILKDDVNDLDVNTSIGYSPSLLIQPDILTVDVIPHTFNIGLNSKYERKLGENQNIIINTENSLETTRKFTSDIYVEPKDKIKSKLDIKYINKMIKNLDLEVKLLNDFDLDTIKKVKKLNPNKFSEKFDIEVGTKFTGIDKFELNNSAKFHHSSGYNYVTRKDDKIVATFAINSIELNSNTKYTNKIKENLNLNTEVNLKAKFDTLMLRNEKLYHYNINDIESYKEKPLISDTFNTRYNIGGSLEINPKFNLEYMLTKNLSLDGSLGLNLVFEKKVINLIKDSRRPDNGQFGPVDKKFEFRKLNPMLEFNLKYTW